MYECYKDLYSADSSGNKNWLKAVIYLFESNGFQLSNLADYLELDQQTVLKKVKQNLYKIDEEYVFEAVNPSFTNPFGTHTFYQEGGVEQTPQLSQKPLLP